MQRCGLSAQGMVLWLLLACSWNGHTDIELIWFGRMRLGLVQHFFPSLVTARCFSKYKKQDRNETDPASTAPNITGCQWWNWGNNKFKWHHTPCFKQDAVMKRSHIYGSHNFSFHPVIFFPLGLLKINCLGTYILWIRFLLSHPKDNSCQNFLQWIVSVFTRQFQISHASFLETKFLICKQSWQFTVWCQIQGEMFWRTKAFGSCFLTIVSVVAVTAIL